MRRGPAVAAAAVMAAVVVAACSSAADRPSPSTGATGQGPGRGIPRSASQTSPNLPHPSPTAQAWGSCGNIRGEADARALVADGAATALVEARITGAVVKSYRVLAGQVSGLRTLNDDLTAPRGRYILLVGGASPNWSAALGYYGVYRIIGEHAYQMCAYGGPAVPRGGVTELGQVVELLRHALRK